MDKITKKYSQDYQIRICESHKLHINHLIFLWTLLCMPLDEYTRIRRNTEKKKKNNDHFILYRYEMRKLN